ncbi:poly [ADP-ribose] polymerase 2 isoform X2 [Seriola lalandi dorsalis]|uniref:Poly [ADP-ribose] polymerase n=1 Tax=Seriola lalandi dorsalis TaxID=1841481 RepID=A0A3B4XBC1_SERLL|nr:poly [ADP-ribose] polymerase 2 isoform X1 [Seriola lalandi dorsalis]XP_023280203.1 poly [ADP-ribose] polymerase 2 isoform X2 [Seriola lalandi dorsalis]
MRRTRGSRNKSQGAAENEEVRSKAVWQWKGDEGQWEPYSPSDCALLDSAVSSGKTSVTLTLGSGAAYEVDLKKMVQINPVTKYKRKIRSQTVKPESLNEAGESTAHNGRPVQVKEEEEEEETEEQPATKRRRGQSKRQTKTKEMPKEEIKEVVRTVVMKGKAPVDSECKAKLGQAHVYSEGNDVYDVMLNQTNLQFNNNKYYLIQLLEDDNSKVYSVWMRWGRVGKVGQNSLTAFGGDLLKAKDVFKKKFLDKTKNEWEQRASFEKVAGKYDMVFMDYSTNEKEEEKTTVDTVPKKKISKLDVKIQSLLELICDLKAMEECVLEMKFDTRKAPLGKLTSEQIRAGYSALKRIEECLKRKGSNRELLEACNQFYTRIPHDFGLKTPPVIHTEDELKKKIALLEALSDIQIAVKMVQSSEDGDEHPLDRQYRSLQCKLNPLDSSTHEYQVIEKYLQSTHASTHCDYSMTVLDIFSVDRDGESNSFLSQLHNRTLLWHGSRLSNWVGILSKGLRVAPPEAPVTGYMFGKGIYFADMSSKSANYCFANQHNHVGLLLLCEVALGDSNELVDADYEASSLPAGKHSTKGLGQTGPDSKNSVTLDGVTVPMGPGVKTGVGKNSSYSLLYNEFIVYNPAQTRMKYLLRIQFNYSSLW